MRPSLILIEMLSKYARFPVSLKLSVCVYGRLVELFDWAELIESVRRVAVTTSGAVNSSGPPSTEICRSGLKLTIGRRAVDETCRERKRGALLLPLPGRRQPFYDAVVAERGAAVRGRREAAPMSKPSRRPRWPRGRTQAALLLPLILHAAAVHVAAYVSCSFSFLLVVLGPLFLCDNCWDQCS